YCRVPQQAAVRRARCGSDGSRVDTWVHHSLRKCVCHQRVKRLRLRCHCLEEETPIYGRCRGARKGRSAGQPPDHVREAPDRNCRCVKRTRVKKIPCACHLLNYRTKRCENKKKRFVIRDYRFTEGARALQKNCQNYQRSNQTEASTKSACGKRGYQTVTLTYHKLVSCACVKKHKKRRTTELTIGRVVLLPPPQNRYACLVKKVKMKRRCACPKPARTVKCRRNVLITVTVTQKLKGQKCIKAKKVDKKATKCPKNSISETKCRSDNTKVVTKVTYRKRNCKCERKVKHRRVLCRCPDPIISTRCVRHTIKERSTVSYQLKSERCRRKKQVSKKKIKCKGGTKVTRTKCDKRCNQKVTKVTRYIRNCECRKKTDISSVKCCCPKSVTRVACIDDSRRVVTTTSWRLVRGACQRKARKREKKIVCLSNLKPIRGPCKRNGYRQVTFVSYRLRKCKCVRVQRKSNELCLPTASTSGPATELRCESCAQQRSTVCILSSATMSMPECLAVEFETIFRPHCGRHRPPSSRDSLAGQNRIATNSEISEATVARQAMPRNTPTVRKSICFDVVPLGVAVRVDVGVNRAAAVDVSVGVVEYDSIANSQYSNRFNRLSLIDRPEVRVRMIWARYGAHRLHLQLPSK
uniref:VWFA domain-containing protein n=1 Tax=Macrostomum lignano TaxID=282301 RepID=A0A1I8HCF7_9PLAT